MAIFAKGLFSTPGLVQRTPLVYPILLKCKYIQIHWHNYQAIFSPNLNISIKHKQIGGQSVRFALHKSFSITVGCRCAWHRIRWFQHSRDSLKGSGSSDVCQVSVGPTRAADIQDPNSNAIATQYCNSNLSREICSNRRLWQDSRIQLLEVLNRPTTDVDFWTAFLSGTDGWLQPLKLYAACNVLRGETAFRQEEDNVESFSSSGSVLLLLAIRTLLQRLTGCC